MLEQLFLLGERLQCRQSFRWQKQPSKSQAAEEVPGASLMPGAMTFCPAGVLSWTSCFQVEELGKEVSRLHNIIKDEREIDTIFSEMRQLEEPHAPSAMEKQEVSSPTIKVSATSGAGEGWKLVTSGTKRKAPAPPKSLQLQNRFTALKI